MLTLDQVMTLTEAADKWGYSDGSTIRKAIERGRFEDHEIKRSGRVWLLTYDAMCRVFGEPVIKYDTELIDCSDLMKSVMHQSLTTDDPQVINKIKEIYSILNKKKSIILQDSKSNVIIKLDSIDEANLWIRRMRYPFKLSQSTLKELGIR